MSYPTTSFNKNPLIFVLPLLVSALSAAQCPTSQRQTSQSPIPFKVKPLAKGDKVKEVSDDGRSVFVRSTTGKVSEVQLPIGGARCYAEDHDQMEVTARDLQKNLDPGDIVLMEYSMDKKINQIEGLPNLYGDDFKQPEGVSVFGWDLPSIDYNSSYRTCMGGDPSFSYDEDFKKKFPNLLESDPCEVQDFYNCYHDHDRKRDENLKDSVIYYLNRKFNTHVVAGASHVLNNPFMCSVIHITGTTTQLVNEDSDSVDYLRKLAKAECKRKKNQVPKRSKTFRGKKGGGTGRQFRF